MIFQFFVIINVNPNAGHLEWLSRPNFTLFQDIANVLGYDTSNIDTLWKDRVNVELSVAVLDSFKKAGAAIVNHHTLVSK